MLVAFNVLKRIKRDKTYYISASRQNPKYANNSKSQNNP